MTFLEVRGSSVEYDWILEVGGVPYTNDEIANDVTISTSVSSEGYSIGNCTSCSISGTLAYKYNDLQKNAFVTLYRKYSDGTKVLFYQWMLTDYSVYDKKSVSFSASDAMMFAENAYGMTQSIGHQLQVAAETITNLSGLTVTIDVPNNVGTKYVYDVSGWTIRQLLSYVAAVAGSNYKVEIPEYGKANFVLSALDYVEVSKDNYAPLTIGAADTKISCVDIRQKNNADPDTSDSTTLESYGIYRVVGSEPVTPAGTLKVISPIADADCLTSTALSSLIGKSFGTEFSCPSVKVDRILSPLTQIKFEGETATFYVSSATYRLTVMGLIASVSGTARALSDYEFVGTTQKDLQQRVALGLAYGSCKITQAEGVVWDDSNVGEATNSG